MIFQLAQVKVDEVRRKGTKESEEGKEPKVERKTNNISPHFGHIH
jgi:hypothetical protein